MKFTREQLFNFVRIVFGLVWAIDAGFKWTPAFLNGLPGMLSDTAMGQPAFIAWWINFWLGLVNINPFAWAIGIAIIESILAIGLIFGVFKREIYWLGLVFSFFVWSVGEGCGGPYMAGSTDIGACIIYVFVFALLLIGIPKQQNVEKTKGSNSATAMNVAILTIVILVAVLITPYLISPTQTSTMGMQMAVDMPPGMMLKEFDIPASSTPPTIDLVITKDKTDGYDIHILTTNFTFTPEKINTDPILDQGHVHIYVDGVLSVVFSPWYHIGDLAPGKHTISASLNANDHSVFTFNGKHIDVAKTVDAY